MRHVGLTEMSAFVAIAERSSFVKASTQLGVSRSTLSETLRSLEAKLGVRLLNRTTRSVGLTEAGERLLSQLRPALDNLNAVMESVNVFRDKPAGHLRLTMPRPAMKTVIEPILARFMTAYPAITLEVVVDSALTDIVRHRFDAGIRPGSRVERDMIAIRIGDDARPTVVASPGYLARHPRPKAPADLGDHNCVRQRFASGAMNRWIFEKRGKSLEVAVSGSLIASDGDLALRAGLEGLAIARLPRHAVEAALASNKLVALLEDWAPRPVGYYLYYPSRRQMPVALKVLIDTIKARPSRDEARPQYQV
jgi:DNA-binding transcriptional LysR family regulator